MTVTQAGTPAAVAIQSANNTGSVTGAWGTGQNRTAGNILVAGVTAFGSTTSGTISTPAGWTQQVVKTSSTGRSQVAIYTKVAAGADAAPNFTSTMTGTASLARMSCELFELTGQDSTTPVVTTGNGDAVASPVTITTAGNVVRGGSYAVDCVNVGLSTATTCTYTPDASWTAVYDQSAVSARSHSAAEVFPSPPTGGTLSSAPAATGTINEMTGVSIAVQPPAAPPVPPPLVIPQALRRAAYY